MPPRRALLIDDEPLARMELRRLLAAHAYVTIAGEAGTVADARTRLGRPDYDLVFLDIQLRGGSGFDLLDSVHPEAQVVFVTAYDRFALRAFEVNALDYLLKPVAAARLATTLQRLGDGRDQPVVEAAPVTAGGANQKLTTEDRVFVKTGTATRFVPVASICAVRSAENYTVRRARAREMCHFRYLPNPSVYTCPKARPPSPRPPHRRHTYKSGRHSRSSRTKRRISRRPD